MTYNITIIHNADGSEAYANANHPTRGYIESFYGPTFKADAIRFVKRLGGRNAKFEFTSYHASKGFSR